MTTASRVPEAKRSRGTAPTLDTGRVRRERTAIRRATCSRPLALALADGVISRTASVFDYGCGHGGDIRYLRARGVHTSGWDPSHRPRAKVVPADVVNLGYVLNVIEEPTERTSILQRAFALARQVLIVSVRVEALPDERAEFGDGLLTSVGTFQKYFSQTEIRTYVEETLDVTTHAAALGVLYVFKDAEVCNRYLANRAFSRRLEYRRDLLEEFARHPVARRYVRMANRLGRCPSREEFEPYWHLIEAFGTVRRIERLTLYHVDRVAFSGSAAQRREDILTYAAMLRLEGLRPPPLKALPASVRSDIKAGWGSYAAALAEGETFLFALGQPERIRRACDEAKIGKLLPGHLYVHRSAEDELPAMLRLLIFAARRVVGEVACDVVKIAVDGRAISFLRYADFDDDPHPTLLSSVRVYLPRAQYGVRRYDASISPPILHRKDTLVDPTYTRFAEFRALSEQEETLGLLSAPEIGTREAWQALLKARGLILEGHRVVGTANVGT